MSQITPWYVVATRLRKKQRITLQVIADRLGVAKSTVGHWLTGHNPAPLKAIKEIAMVLGTTEIELLADDPFYVIDPQEREVLNRIREIPESRRKLAFSLVESALAALKAEKDPPSQD